MLLSAQILHIQVEVLEVVVMSSVQQFSSENLCALPFVYEAVTATVPQRTGDKSPRRPACEILENGFCSTHTSRLHNVPLVCNSSFILLLIVWMLMWGCRTLSVVDSSCELRTLVLCMCDTGATLECLFSVSALCWIAVRLYILYSHLNGHLLHFRHSLISQEHLWTLNISVQ